MPQRQSRLAPADAKKFSSWLRLDIVLAVVLSATAVLLTHVVWHARAEATLLEGPSLVLGIGQQATMHRCRVTPLRRQLWCTMADGGIMSIVLRTATNDWIGHTVPQDGVPLSVGQDQQPDRATLRFNYRPANPALRRLPAWGPSAPYVWPQQTEGEPTWGQLGWAPWPFDDVVG